MFENLDLDLNDLMGLTFWGFLLSATTVGFGYVLTHAKARFKKLIFEGSITPISLLELVGISLGIAGTTLMFGYVLDKTKNMFQKLLFENVY